MILTFSTRANIPFWALTLFQSLSEDTQATLVQVGSKAVLDPWVGALASIPAFIPLILLPHFVKTLYAVPVQNINYNNETPRKTDWQKTFAGQDMLVSFFDRCAGCHENSWEAFIMFAPAVILCRLQSADGHVVRNLCYQFLRLRVFYFFLYLSGHFKVISILRTATWMVSMKVIFELYFTALAV